MPTKKRVLITTFGAVVALTLQTPVSAYIMKARGLAVGKATGHHRAPSYLTEAFSDAGRRLLQADRWSGWKAAVPDLTFLDELDSSARDASPTRFDSTLGKVELGDLGAEKASTGLNSSGESISGDAAAKVASIRGNGAAGSRAGGAGGAGGGSGGGAAGGGGGGGGGGAYGAGAAGFEGAHGSAAGASEGAANFLATVPRVFGNGFSPLTFGNPASGGQIDPISGGGTSGLNVESPEPTTLVFLAGGLAGLVARRRRRNGSQREPLAAR